MLQLHLIFYDLVNNTARRAEVAPRNDSFWNQTRPLGINRICWRQSRDLDLGPPSYQPSLPAWELDWTRLFIIDCMLAPVKGNRLRSAKLSTGHACLQEACLGKVSGDR